MIASGLPDGHLAEPGGDFGMMNVIAGAFRAVKSENLVAPISTRGHQPTLRPMAIRN